MVNALYSPETNAFYVFEGLMTAPLFSMDNTDSQNYGGIGVVIGHEISHAFDQTGSEFDKYGNYNDIWNIQDRNTFNTLATKMVKEFDGISLFGHHVNGNTTLGENIADNGGLNVSLEVAKTLPDFDANEFFSTWAQGWAAPLTPSFYTRDLFEDAHTPSALRANVALQNIDDFYTTYNIQPGDPMYLAPENRVHIW